MKGANQGMKPEWPSSQSMCAHTHTHTSINALEMSPRLMLTWPVTHACDLFTRNVTFVLRQDNDRDVRPDWCHANVFFQVWTGITVNHCVFHNQSSGQLGYTMLWRLTSNQSIPIMKQHYHSFGVCLWPYHESKSNIHSLLALFVALLQVVNSF